MFNFIKKNASKFADEIAGKRIYWLKSSSDINLYGDILKNLKKYCRGKTLDLGAGRLAYRSMIKKFSSEYFSTDFKKTHPDLDFVANAQDLNMIKDDDFDTVFCSQVLEHVPEPQKVLNEIKRILKNDGKAIITVPFLGYLHNEPYDFFRYTKHSLKYMAEKSGLQVIEIKESGGLISFLGYIWSTFFVGFFGGFPILNYIVLLLNIPISFIFFSLDAIFPSKKIMPLNYILILSKNK